jgi:D-glycero-D-manno-heptose 1,7-bisphosphate phosphatase
MAPVNGKPFLFHLLQQVAEQGIVRFVLLIGYKAEHILEYFKDGSQWNWSIEYSQGPIEWDTGRRLWEARQHFDANFLLLYSDNFVQFRLERLIELQERRGLPISLLLAPKAKGNIRISSDGTVNAYDKSRNGEGFDFVEVGYMFIKRDIVLARFLLQPGFPDFNFSSVLKEFASQSSIAGLPVLDRYHSISDPVRLQLTCDYLEHKRILLIDRDGTINIKAPQGEYVTKWDNFEWIPETRKAMKQLAGLGFKFIVITNQAGIARGMIAQNDLDTIHRNMIAEMASENIEILKVFCCPDHWADASFMRKPSPGMFFQAAEEFKLRMDRCIYIGDDERDCIAAANAGCGMLYLSDVDQDPILDEYPKPYFRAKSLLECVGHIGQIYCEWEVTA